ncbi:HSP90 family molecular chaperone [Haloactinomyces albus]|uniref:HSP90 family molecular chaperone n=1 Tax=Haloactinomyces albus TaxID=1352928 RepID=A0AAE3ZH55_9ACTN|nr:HSP90 family molecular chaperone [Haloactinomyces albus]
MLLLTDPVDEMWVESAPEFDGKRFQSIAKGQVDLDEQDEDGSGTERAQQEQEFAEVLSWMSTKLADDVKEVRLSSRLSTSPACVVGDNDDIGPTLEKMYRAMGHEVPQVKRILEVNPNHPLVSGMRDAYDKNGESQELKETAELVHGMALLAEGGELREPAEFTTLLATRLARTL